MMIRDEYMTLILTIDRTLSMLREGWLTSTRRDAHKWMGRIDAALDERYRLMLLRDAA